MTYCMTYNEQRKRLIENIRDGVIHKGLHIPLTPGLPGRFMTWYDFMSQRSFIIHEDEVFGGEWNA